MQTNLNNNKSIMAIHRVRSSLDMASSFLPSLTTRAIQWKRFLLTKEKRAD